MSGELSSINKQVLESLKEIFPDIPDNCIGLTLRLAAGEAPTIECRHFVNERIDRDPRIEQKTFRVEELL